MARFSTVLTTLFMYLLQAVFLVVGLLVTVVELLKSLLGNKKRPAPKAVLITGATSGIGEALAQHYASPGVTIAITGRREAELQRVRALCEAKGATVATLCADVSDKEKLAAWIKTVDARAPLDLVIANAGVTESTSKTDSSLEAAAYGVFATNVTGVFNTIFPALEGMRARRSGQVALMASLAGFTGLTGNAAYSASKAAVRVYGEALRAELAAEGVRVSVITPGYVKSPMTDANKFKQPGMVSMSYAIKAITSGLATDDALIAFPPSTFAQAWALGTVPGLVRDFLARNRIVPPIAYRRPRKAASPAAPAAAATSKQT